jgi:hypothetical protein
METDAAKWSGEGTFTQKLLDVLREMDGIEFLRVEDAPASRSDADYNFVSNEIYVRFREDQHVVRARRFGVIPSSQTRIEKRLSIAQLADLLAATADIGPADYIDEGMIQYLKSERIVPPYQTRGYKLVELVRVYEVGTTPRR